MRAQSYRTTRRDRVLSRRRLLGSAAGSSLGLGGLLLAACGGGGSDDDRASDVPQAGAIPTSAAAAADPGAPKMGGVLRVAIRADPPHLEAYQVNSFPVATVWGIVYNGLVRFQSGAAADPLDMKIVPDAAGRYERPDSLTYVFSLNQGLKFQNVPPVSGRDATAVDVKYSLERLGTRDAAFRFSYMMDGVETIEAPDATTVRIKTKQPNAPLINYLASIYGSIVPREVAERDGDFKRTAIGTGPFILRNWERNSKLEYVRNPDYWDRGKPYLDGITVLIIADPSTQQASFTTKQTSIVTGISDPLQVRSITSEVKDAVSEDSLSRSIAAFRFRFDRPPLSDQRVRQALNMTYDRKGGVDAVFGGRAIPSGTLGPAYKDDALAPDQLGPSYQFDPKKAKDLLTAAGVANGFETEAVVTSAGHGKVSADSGAYLRDQLKAIGVTVKINDMEYARFLDQLYVADFDMQRAGWAASHDIDEFLSTSYNYFEAGARKKGFDPRFTELLEKERITLDMTERRKIVQDLQRHLADQAYAIHTDGGVSTDFWHPNVKNYRPHSLLTLGWGSRVWREIWLEQ